MTDTRRTLPSVSALLESDGVRALLESAPRGVVVSAIREVVGLARGNADAVPTTDDAWTRAIAERVDRAQRPSLRPVINATGIVLHTNLGRAPLAPVALAAIAHAASGYSNLEFDLEAGARGSRYTHCASLLCELTGAEDALVVNNCAAALVLALDTLSHGREAVLSRGELVEIGGSFRVHDIMAKSGAFLREVGATNRTHLSDYANAVGRNTGVILKVHRSNFSLEGFVAEVDVNDLVPLAKEHGVPILHDLGSGLLVSLEDMGLSGEPTAREALDAGARVVVMSGDKLLGGPQAGLILGAAHHLDAMRRNPLARSYRVDKLTLAALEATLALYREPLRAKREIPTLAMLGASVLVVRARADRVAQALRAGGVPCMVIQSEASVGAGAFPRVSIPRAAVALTGNADDWSSALRAGESAVVGRTHDGELLLDLRAVADAQVDALVAAVLKARPHA